MNERTIVGSGTPEEVLDSHVIEEVFQTRLKRFRDEDGEYFFFG